MQIHRRRLIDVRPKKRFKLYKSGKLWLVAGVVVGSLLGGVGFTTKQVHADSVTEKNSMASQASSSSTSLVTSKASQINNTKNSTAESEANQASNAKTTTAISAVNQVNNTKSSTATSETSQASSVSTSTANSKASQINNTKSSTAESEARQASNTKTTTATSAVNQVNNAKSSTSTSETSQASSASTSTANSKANQADSGQADTTKSQAKVTPKSVIKKAQRATATTTDIWTIGDTTRPRVDVVDVSSYQSAMTQADYNKLKLAGVKTVIVKATEGENYTNQAAVNQAKMANKAGINVDFYHYATFDNSAAAQAEASNMGRFLTNNRVSKKVLLFADMEDTTTYSVNATANLNAFWAALNALGYTNHGVYTSNTYLYRDAVIKTVGQSRVWRAQYPYSPSAGNLWNTGDGAWQFSSTANLPLGSDYTGYLDVSISYNGLTEDSAGTNTFSTPSKFVNQYHWEGDKLYFYGSDGQPITGFRQYGNNKLEYYGVDHVQYRNRYVTVNNQLYYFGSNGDAITGFRHYGNGKLEYYGTDHVQYRNRYVTVNNQLYYFGSNGDAITGLRYYGSGKLEYYGTDHVQYRNRYVTVNNQLYYFGSNGDAITGFRHYGNGKLEYYGTDHVQYRNRYVTVNNKLYYFGSNGDGWLVKK
ncbi:GH25 family lysozyme (plasmid) [Lactiplantibacillus plantarum]